MRPLVTMIASDLRQRLRDRSLPIFGVLVPLALMTALNFVIGGAWDPDVEDVTLAVSAAPDDPMAATVLQVLDSLDAVTVTIEAVSAEEAAARPEAGEANLGLVFPADFGTAIRAGDPVTVELIEGGSAGLGSAIVVSVVEEILARLGAGSVVGLQRTVDRTAARTSSSERSGWKTSHSSPATSAAPNSAAAVSRASRSGHSCSITLTSVPIDSSRTWRIDSCHARPERNVSATTSLAKSG